jgi:hypothetical protein
MQTAYEEYCIATKALESAFQADESSTIEQLRFRMAADQQRIAFERYVDGRMAFLEYQFDKIHGPGACRISLTDQAQPLGMRARFGTPLWKLLLGASAVALMCITAFSSFREHEHVRDLEASHDELRAMLSNTRDGLRTIRQKLDVAGLPENAAGQKPDGSLRVPTVDKLQGPLGATPLVAAPKSSGGRQVGQLAARKGPNAQRQTQSVAPRTPESFSLTPSREFKRVGPIELSLRSIHNRKDVSMVIVSDRIRMDVLGLSENSPVWIRGDHQRLGLVIDHISRNRVVGHLLEPRGNVPQTSAGITTSSTYGARAE